MRTIHIATYGEGQEGIVAGIRNFPVHKLVLLCYEEEKAKAEEFSNRIRSTLGIPVSCIVVSDKNVIREVLERIAQVIKDERDFEQILMNVSAGDKM